MVERLDTRSALGTLATGASRTLGELPHARMIEWPIHHAFWLQFTPGDRDVLAAVRKATGMALEGEGRAVQQALGTALWMGPGSWLLEPVRDPLRFEADLASALAGVAHVLTDVSDLWFRVRLEGNRIRDVLVQGCALDLHPLTFPAGASGVAQFARIRALIHHLGGQSAVYHIYVERSFARYLWTWLADAMTVYLD